MKDHSPPGIGVRTSHIQFSLFHRIGQHALNAPDAQRLMRIGVQDSSVLHFHQVAAHGQSVHEAVMTGPQICHGDRKHGFIPDHIEPQVLPDLCYRRDPGCGADVDSPLRILRNRPDALRHQLAFPVDARHAAMIHQIDPAVVGADPQAVLPVHIQTPGIENAGFGIHQLKRVSVIADQARIAADPDEALTGLRDRIGLRGRQTVAVIVKNG